MSIFGGSPIVTMAENLAMCEKQYHCKEVSMLRVLTEAYAKILEEEALQNW